jgi:hypothetical protein
MDPVYETRKQKIKKSKSKDQIYSKKHVRIQEKIKQSKDSLIQKQKKK